MGSKILFEVVMTAELKNPESGEYIPCRMVIHVYTDDTLLKAGQKALDYISDGYVNKIIQSIKPVGEILVIA